MTKAITKPSPLMLALEDRFTAFLAEVEAGLSQERAAIETWLATVQASLAVTDADSCEKATDVARLAKARLDALEADRGVFSKPLHHWKGQIDKAYKGLTGPLAQVIVVAKDRMGEYAAKKAQERAAIMQQSAAEHQAGGMPTTPIPEPVQVAGVSIRIRWVATVVEPDLVPRDLCSPDLAKIQERISYADTATTPPRPIPGLVFQLDTSTTIRAAKP